MTRLAILTDFDGTITAEDCQNALLDAYGRPDWREAEKRVLAAGGKSRRYYPELYRDFRASAAEAQSFILSHARVDPGFWPFAEFCARHGIQLEVTSDGFELYLRPLLGEDLFARLKATHNRAYLDERPVRFEHPFHNPECGLCGVCKSSRVHAYHEQGYRVIYVGDGGSDECPARYADEVWAKRHLLTWCADHSVACHEFKGFADLQRELSRRLGAADTSEDSAGPDGD